MAHGFPGNVRELENIIEHAFVLCRKNIIEIEHLPQELQPLLPRQNITPTSKTSLDELQAHFIFDALERNKWNRLATAKELGMHKTTLFRKIKQLGIKLPKQDGRASYQPKHQ